MGTESRPSLPILVPPVDVYESDAEVLLFVDLPGATPESVHLELDGGSLALSAERADGPLPAVAWKRSFVVPPALRGESIAAELRDGVLKVRFPRAPRPERRVIEVRAA